MPHIGTEYQDILWFKDSIIYELHIKAFKDGNADGIGDFEGLIESLDYLQDLGVTTIWLLPFYPSPQRDGGYDISDYYNINPDYGNLNQFRKFMRKAHERGLKVITELVINHTSDQHPWFQRARRAEPGSKYRDYYVWSDTTEKYKDVRIIFQDFESSNWTWDPVANAYYWHRFYSHQPDLNYDHPDVQKEIFRVIDFWVDLGVDGFRLDAVPYLFERDGTNCENLPETHDFLKKLRAHVDKRNSGVMLLAEANMWPEDSAAYFGDGDECHMNYHFPIMPRMFMALKMEDRYPIIDIIDQTPEIPDNCQWAMFLRNHDELTLEMVTDEERDYMYRAYNKDTLSRINLGIRHRLAPLLDNHRQKVELMNCLLFSLPGTPVVYYGDEIGMGDNVHLGDRDGVRTPMQWSIDRNAGFSQAHPHKLYLPLINDPEYHFETINVEVQQNSTSSLLWWMKRIINIRKRYQAFGRGDIQFLSPENAKVLAFTRSYKDEHLLILTNLSRHPQAVELELPEFERYTPVEVFGQNPFPEIARGPNRFTLGPYGYFWFALQPATVNEEDRESVLEIAWQPEHWLQLAKGNGTNYLADEILPSFLGRNDRYTLGNRVLDRVNIHQARYVTYDGGEALLLIIQVNFTEGFPEWYFLPLTIGEGDPYQLPDAPAPDNILAVLRGSERNAYLYEASITQAFHTYLFRNLLFGSERSPQGFRFVRHNSNGRNDIDEVPATRFLKPEGGNLPLAFGDQYFLKIFRRLEDHINPDLEINFQKEQRGDLPVPGYLGHLQFDRKQHQFFTLAMLQPYVANQGSAWQYFFDVSHRYLERVQAEPELPDFPTWGGLNSEGDVAAEWKARLGEMPLVRARLLGETVANLQVGLIDHKLEAFRPESFSLHYQRSLYSGLQSLVRSTFQLLRKQRTLPKGGGELLDLRRDLLERFRQIYAHKMDALKVRTHGDLHLKKILFTGREFVTFDFEGERGRSYSELRLKKSPVRDLATLINSLYYVSVASLRTQEELENLEECDLLPWAECWFEIMKTAFLEGYLPKAKTAGLAPPNNQDWNTLLSTFLLERHLYELRYELKVQRGLEQIPLRGLLRMMRDTPQEIEV